MRSHARQHPAWDISGLPDLLQCNDAQQEGPLAAVQSGTMKAPADSSSIHQTQEEALLKCCNPCTSQLLKGCPNSSLWQICLSEAGSTESIACFAARRSAARTSLRGAPQQCLFPAATPTLQCSAVRSALLIAPAGSSATTMARSSARSSSSSSPACIAAPRVLAAPRNDACVPGWLPPCAGDCVSGWLLR